MSENPKPDPARRLQRLQTAIRRGDLDAMIVHDRSNAYYLTGFPSSLSYVIVTADEARVLVDGRYIEAARQSITHCEVELFKKLSKSLAAWQRRIKPRRIGLEGSSPWKLWRELSDYLPGVEWREAENLILDHRLIKSGDEIRKLAASAKMNDEIYEAALSAIEPGMTELDVRRFIRAEADRRGAQGEAFDCIVGTGASAAGPHHHSGPTPLKRGELLLIDMGVVVDGYCSDMTRVVALGRKPGARVMRMFDAVLEAEQAALDAVGPGVKAADLHQIAVGRLKARKLARFFTHGLGHGVGLQVHEAPRLNTASTDVLRPGMVVTIEPGVYVPGLAGVRIEDLAVVTRTGHRVLSKARKSFRVIPFDA